MCQSLSQFVFRSNRTAAAAASFSPKERERERLVRTFISHVSFSLSHSLVAFGSNRRWDERQGKMMAGERNGEKKEESEREMVQRKKKRWTSE